MCDVDYCCEKERMRGLTESSVIQDDSWEKSSKKTVKGETKRERRDRINLDRKRAIMNKVRTDVGLPVISIGEVTCLKCHEKFFSENKAKQRICEECSTSNLKYTSHDNSTLYG